MNKVSYTTANNTKYILLNINGVITSIPKDEIDIDWLNEISGN